MKLSQIDRRKLMPLLDELSRAIEDLLLTGLTTASQQTINTLTVSFQEASRMGLLRLGSTLRIACDELGRYTRNQADFSRNRFSFFLNRSWLLTRGLSKAIDSNNEAEFERLVWVPANHPVDKLEVVTLGISKKVTSAFVAFDFRLRTIGEDSAMIAAGTKMVWSCVFPVRADSKVPAEGYLHLPQKQKFNAIWFAEGKTMLIENAAVAVDKWGTGRINLGEKSVVTAGSKFEQWDQFLSWDQAEAATRIEATRPGPMDLDIEMLEEVAFSRFLIADRLEEGDDRPYVYPIISDGITYSAIVARGVEGASIDAAIAALRDDLKEGKAEGGGTAVKLASGKAGAKLVKASARAGKGQAGANAADSATDGAPTLYGLMHYERCQLRFQPLTVFSKKGPEYITLSKDKIDRAVLLKTLNLT